MKITTFNPQIITQQVDHVVDLFENIGFEKRHRQEGIGENKVTGVRMRDPEGGFYLDISESDAVPGHDLEAIRMNVDDFDAYYDLLIRHGFKNYYEDHSISTPTSKSALMISPSGFAINLIEHIK